MSGIYNIPPFSYHKKGETKYLNRYRCAHSRLKNVNCPAGISINKDTKVVKPWPKMHTCNIDKPSTQLDLTDKAISKAKEITASNPTASTSSIINQTIDKLNTEFNDPENVYIKPTRKTLTSYINNTKQQIFPTSKGSEYHETSFANLSEIDDRKFLRFDFTFTMSNITKLQDRNKLNRLIIWAHPELSVMLKRADIRIHIDGTFRCVPHPFSQCLVLMIHDDETDLNIPTVFALVDTKHSWGYWHFLHFCSVLAECKMNPKYIICNYETGIINTAREYFPSSIIIGCDFHMKRAVKRKMEKLGLSKKSIRRFMKKKMVDRWKKCKKTEIEYEIVRARAIFKEENNEKDKWNRFYKYFTKVWIRKSFDLWNFSEMGQADELDQVPKTNNCLENFNRVFNNKFPKRHPNIYEFIQVIKEISIETVSKVNGERRLRC
jgi:hypothetical protein